MKKFAALIIALILMPAMYVQAQSDSEVANTLAQIEQNRELTSRYKLYQAITHESKPSDKFLMLDTQTGKIDFIQGSQRVPINVVDLTNGNGKVSGLFELHAWPGYKFNLYCKLNGAAWYLNISGNSIVFEPITGR
ncbi:MAG: hypothetical protein HUK14_10650 [Muribaculaceae bacterium]|mgnify:FL=1|nr:hypothetical protein [Muribaculaceae bacterium]